MGTIFIKCLFECLFRRDNGQQHYNKLYTNNAPTKYADCIDITSIKRNLNQNRRNKKYPTQFPPQSSAVPIGKVPCLHILHGTSRSIPKSRVNLFGRIFPKCSADNDHSDWKNQVANKHEPPKPHIAPPLHIWIDQSFFLNREMLLMRMEAIVSPHSALDMVGTTSISADQSSFNTHWASA